MTEHSHLPVEDPRKFTLTAFISFVVVFVFLMFMRQCHGDFVPENHSEKPAAEHTAH